MEIGEVDKVKFAENLKPAYAEFAKRFGQSKLDEIRDVK